MVASRWPRLGCLLIVVAAGACDRRPDRAAPALGTDPADTAVAQVGFGVHHALTTRGVRRAELRADTARFSGAGTVAELRGVHLVLYSVAGDSVGALAAPAATYRMRERRVTLRGGVTLLVAGRRSTAPQAVYDVATARVTGTDEQPTGARSAARPSRR